MASAANANLNAVRETMDGKDGSELLRTSGYMWINLMTLL